MLLFSTYCNNSSDYPPILLAISLVADAFSKACNSAKYNRMNSLGSQCDGCCMGPELHVDKHSRSSFYVLSHKWFNLSCL